MILLHFDWSRVFLTQRVHSYFFHRSWLDGFIIAVTLGVHDGIYDIQPDVTLPKAAY